MSTELRIPNVRHTPDPGGVQADLLRLAFLEGSWRGKGFNVVARPDKEGNANLYLEINETVETLKFDAIGSAIPNRGFAMDDIELYGLTYLQKISDRVTGGALHIEPGIWVTQPNTSAPPEEAPDGSQIVGRMGSIPHGNAILAEGEASPFSGAPTLGTASAKYNGSVFPSFNITPFGVGAPIFAEGTAEYNLPPPPPPAPPGGFSQYNLANVASNTNPRTPFGNVPAVPLPNSIDGVAIQDLLNDPILLLQAKVKEQISDGYQFEGTVINIASQQQILFGTLKNQTAPTSTVSVPQGGGSIGNIPFLASNAESALVYATFWLETLSHPDRRDKMLQLQYAQMVLLNFPILAAGAGSPLLSWPHVTVGTLEKDFN